MVRPKKNSSKEFDNNNKKNPAARPGAHELKEVGYKKSEEVS